jgi:hypothetical protein
MDHHILQLSKMSSSFILVLLRDRGSWLSVLVFCLFVFNSENFLSFSFLYNFNEFTIVLILKMYC